MRRTGYGTAGPRPDCREELRSGRAPREDAILRAFAPVCAADEFVARCPDPLRNHLGPRATVGETQDPATLPAFVDDHEVQQLVSGKVGAVTIRPSTLHVSVGWVRLSWPPPRPANAVAVSRPKTSRVIRNASSAAREAGRPGPGLKRLGIGHPAGAIPVGQDPSFR